jgi:hypothetical protein
MVTGQTLAFGKSAKIEPYPFHTMKKQTIAVRIGASVFGGGQTIETITRKVYCDTLGNFNRLACRYKGKTYLVQSEAGDLGDPFRANESYLSALFIQSEKPCAWNI